MYTDVYMHNERFMGEIMQCLDLLPNNLGWSWGISNFIENRSLAWWWLLNLVWWAPGSSLYFVYYNKYLLFFILCIWNFHYKEEKPTLTPFWFWLKQKAVLGTTASQRATSSPHRSCSRMSSQKFEACEGFDAPLLTWRWRGSCGKDMVTYRF